MDLLVVSLVGLAMYWLGHAIGFRQGVAAGSAQEAVRRRLAELPRPWDDATRDPAFREAVDEGLRDIAAGRTKP